MKKVLFFAAILMIGLASCANAEQRKLNRMTEAVKDVLTTDAFRDNATIEFFEFTPIRYEVVSINRLDTLTLLNLWDELYYIYDMSEVLAQRVELNHQRVRNYAALRWHDFAERAQREVERDADAMRELLERFSRLNREDSIIRANITNRANSENIYLFTAFVKATGTDNNSGRTENILDTIQAFLNKDMVVLRPRAFEDFD